MDSIISIIDTATTREEVEGVLSSCKLLELRKVANYYSIHLGSCTKAMAKERIVDGTIGAKLRSYAIRKINLNK
ncbi:hypothetical protein D3C71_1159880 [compost metagenome]